MRSLLGLLGFSMLAVTTAACGDTSSTCDELGTNCGGAGGASGDSGTGGTSGSGGTAGTSGTGGQGGEAGTAGAGGDGGTCDITKSPSEESCLIAEEYGIFVSPSGSDATGDGTEAKPYGTLSKAVSEAASSAKNVYACDDGSGYTEA
ncbi:MAG: hypothetical protein KC776_43905, partial [Myxococcales bacterium]|nr:hypothetical protein [Myxococcales bacterium]